MKSPFQIHLHISFFLYFYWPTFIVIFHSSTLVVQYFTHHRQRMQLIFCEYRVINSVWMWTCTVLLSMLWHITPCKETPSSAQRRVGDDSSSPREGGEAEGELCNFKIKAPASKAAADDGIACWACVCDMHQNGKQSSDICIMQPRWKRRNEKSMPSRLTSTAHIRPDEHQEERKNSHLHMYRCSTA